MTLPPAVLWIDPGQMTGIATLLSNDASWGTMVLKGTEPSFAADEFPFAAACPEIEGLCRRYGQTLAIGWERFDINDRTHKKTQAGIKDALHVIGVCRYLTGKYNCRFLGEAQQHTPDSTDRQRLQLLGWWRPGKDDAQSAAAHMLRWLIRENELHPAWRDLLYTQQ